MRLPLFLVAAVVLIVFAIIAAAGVAGINGTCLGSSWFIWAAASFLAYLADLIFGGWGYANGAWGPDAARRNNPPA